MNKITLKIIKFHQNTILSIILYKSNTVLRSQKSWPTIGHSYRDFF